MKKLLLSLIVLSGCEGLFERTEQRWIGECLEEKVYDLNEVKQDWHRVGCFPCIRPDFRHTEPRPKRLDLSKDYCESRQTYKEDEGEKSDGPHFFLMPGFGPTFLP